MIGCVLLFLTGCGTHYVNLTPPEEVLGLCLMGSEGKVGVDNESLLEAYLEARTSLRVCKSIVGSM